MSIEVIKRPTTLVFYSDNVVEGSISMHYGETIEVYVNFYESWLGITGEGIPNVSFTASTRRILQNVDIYNFTTEDPGIYLLRIHVDAPLIPVGIDTEIVYVTILAS